MDQRAEFRLDERQEAALWSMGGATAELPARQYRQSRRNERFHHCHGRLRNTLGPSTTRLLLRQHTVENTAAQYCGYSRFRNKSSRTLHLSRCAEFSRCHISETGVDGTDSRPI